MSKEKQKLGLVLEGGGVKGAYQIGALMAIRELMVEFDGVVGTSIGAINGAIYLERIPETFRRMERDKNQHGF